MRSWRRFLLTALASFISLVFIYALITKFDSPGDRSAARERIDDGTDTSSLGEKELFDWYFRASRNENFTSSSFKTIHQIRSQRKPATAISSETYGAPRNLMEYDSFPRVPPHDFSECRMSNCFDFSRCQTKGPLKVHIVPSWINGQSKASSGESNLIHKNILKIIRESKHFEPDAEKACIFVLEDDTLDRDPLSQSFSPDLANIFGPHNDYGMNHLVFNLYSGSWPDYRENDFAGLQFGAAILAKASNSITHHRPGFDISLPLFSYMHPYSESQHAKENGHGKDTDDFGNRTYFLTFKGKRYVFGSGSETRNSLYHIDNQRDIIMLTTCRHGKNWHQSSDSRCLDDESNYDQHDFVDLMKESTFCLTPRGRRLGSFRYLEALSFGCIPVILSDSWVKPFDEIIDWSSAALQFDQSLLLQVPDLLRDIDSRVSEKMRQECLNLNEQYFSSTEKIILSTLSIIERRINNQINLKL